MSKPIPDELEDIRLKIEDCFVGHNFPNTEITAKLTKLISKREIEARIDEARHWDEHILGSPRRVTVSEKAKSRLTQLTELQEGKNNE